MTEINKSLDQFADRAANKADAALAATHRAANGALDSLQHGVDTLREEVPGTLSRAAAQVDDLTRRGVDRARNLAADVRDRAERTTDNTVGYIRDEPMKSVLIAAAAGAVIAALVGALARSRRDPA